VGAEDFEKRVLAGKSAKVPPTAKEAALTELHVTIRTLKRMLDEKEGLAADLQMAEVEKARVEMLWNTLGSAVLQLEAILELLEKV
jgi:hypothetical protein